MNVSLAAPAAYLERHAALAQMHRPVVICMEERPDDPFAAFQDLSADLHLPSETAQPPFSG